MNPSNDQAPRSFVPVPPESPFSLHNLPYGIFRRPGESTPHTGVAIGDQVLDLTVLEARGLLAIPQRNGPAVFDTGRLNDFMALGQPAWSWVRAEISRLLRAQEPALRDSPLREHALVPRAQVEMLLPAEVGDYSDFYSSREHATNVGIMVRGPD